MTVFKSMRRLLLISGGMLLLFAMPGLSAFNGQDSSFIHIDRDSFNYSEEITVRFENRLNEKIAVITSGCGLKDGGYAPKLMVEREEGGKWVRAGAPICIAIATPPIQLSPGESTSVSIPVRLGLDESRTSGRFRYLFDIRRGVNGRYPANSKVSQKYRISPPFTVKSERE